MNEDLLARASAWIAMDPEESDRSQLESLIEAKNEEELRRRFATPLQFGTAGLRGPEIAGPAGMNRATVRRATQGVVAWLRQRGLDPARGVVVGRDARRGSERFNEETVRVLLGEGVDVYEMPRPLPTPLTAFVLQRLGAAAGVMITASHNPPEDNGYKLYGPDGSQIVAPDDEMVEHAMNSAGPARLGERSSGLHHWVDESLIEEYLAHMRARFAPGSSDLRIAYTPLHGVGGALVTDLLHRSGFREISVVPEQFAPDGTFPTVAFPNPEEPGAMDRVLDLARERDCDVVIANDPDADRLSVAVPQPNGQWRQLRGDEVGWLLGSRALEECAEGDVVATTIVSSGLLARMAQTAGVPCALTLTGFKWVAKANGLGRLAFGYEEALGYGVDPLVGDKDGVSAALAIARLAHDLRAEGRTLLDALEELESRFGVYAGTQLALRVAPPAGREVLDEVMDRVRRHPPESLGGLQVTEVVDLEEGWGTLPATEGLWWSLGEAGRVVVRPSGTEPKLKAYVEVVAPPDGDVARARAEAGTRVHAVTDDLRELLRLA
ncbi:MAG: phospho-sugar mutase [Acidimicrobiaceae bacterium]|nr:phospho-sugar mutase [Acidimicrobiaceae bacterium]